MTGVPPPGSGHSPKGGAAISVPSPAKPSVPNAAHTPGPWRAGIEKDWRPLASEDRDELCTLPHHTFDAVDVFSCPRGDDYEEHKANARLIAAAPEMYEALEPLAKLGRMLDGPFAPALFKDTDAVGVGGAWAENGEPRTLTFGDLRRAAIVIAKARGEQS